MRALLSRASAVYRLGIRHCIPIKFISGLGERRASSKPRPVVEFLVARRVRTVALQIQPRAIPALLFFANLVNGCAVFAKLRRDQTSVVPRAKSVRLVPSLSRAIETEFVFFIALLAGVNTSAVARR